MTGRSASKKHRARPSIVDRKPAALAIPGWLFDRAAGGLTTFNRVHWTVGVTGDRSIKRIFTSPTRPSVRAVKISESSVRSIAKMVQSSGRSKSAIRWGAATRIRIRCRSAERTTEAFRI